MTEALADLRTRLIELPPAGRAVVVFADSRRQARFIEGCMLRNRSHFGLVSAGTTLLGSLSVIDNLRLPLYYHDQSLRHADEDLATLCRVARIDAQALLPRAVATTSRVERIQASFLQSALLRPEVLLCDSLFEGLGAAERQQVAALIEGFHLLFPLRRSACLGVSAPPDGLYPHTAWIDA